MPLTFLENVQEHATPLAGATVEYGVEVHDTGDVITGRLVGVAVPRLVLQIFYFCSEHLMRLSKSLRLSHRRD